MELRATSGARAQQHVRMGHLACPCHLRARTLEKRLRALTHVSECWLRMHASQRVTCGCACFTKQCLLKSAHTQGRFRENNEPKSSSNTPEGRSCEAIEILKQSAGFCINTLALLFNVFTAVYDRVYNANCIVIQDFILMRETANETAVLGGPWQDPVPTTPLASRDGTTVWLQVPRVEPEG